MKLEKLQGEILMGRFRLDTLLGQGGYGAVFEAEQLSVGRPCAVKVLFPHLCEDESTARRFRDEAKATSRLSHPNSIILYDFGHDQQREVLFLAMELLDGCDLASLLARHGPLSVEQTVHIVCQVAGSLQEAHRLGLVHRDIKPQNIMLIERGNDPLFVKVIDFGIAKVVSNNLMTASSLTRTGTVIGTPKYMSPEQVRDEAIDGRADMYALAMVVYKMLVGRTPFEEGTTLEIAGRQIAERPEPLRALRPDLPVDEAFENVLLEALAKAPDDRFDSVADFAQALVEASPVSGNQQRGKLTPMPASSAPAPLESVEVEPVTAPNTPASEEVTRHDLPGGSDVDASKEAVADEMKTASNDDKSDRSPSGDVPAPAAAGEAGGERRFDLDTGPGTYIPGSPSAPLPAVGPRTSATHGVTAAADHDAGDEGQGDEPSQDPHKKETLATRAVSNPARPEAGGGSAAGSGTTAEIESDGEAVEQSGDTEETAPPEERSSSGASERNVSLWVFAALAVAVIFAAGAGLWYVGASEGDGDEARAADDDARAESKRDDSERREERRERVAAAGDESAPSGRSGEAGDDEATDGEEGRDESGGDGTRAGDDEADDGDDEADDGDDADESAEDDASESDDERSADDETDEEGEAAADNKKDDESGDKEAEKGGADDDEASDEKPAAPTRHRVEVRVIPWGTLVVDGREIGQGRRHELDLTEGRHRLQLKQDGEVRAEETVDVSSTSSKIVELVAR